MMLYLIYLIATALFVGLDQLVKKVIVDSIGLGEKIVLIPGFFSLTNVHNYGAGFSILQNARLLLTLIAVVAIVAVTYLLIKTDKKDLLSIVSYLFIISGATGNLIDRIRLGYVVDFLDFIILGYDYPVFNVADCFITVGCFLLIIQVLREGKHAGN